MTPTYGLKSDLKFFLWNAENYSPDRKTGVADRPGEQSGKDTMPQIDVQGTGSLWFPDLKGAVRESTSRCPPPQQPEDLSNQSPSDAGYWEGIQLLLQHSTVPRCFACVHIFSGPVTLILIVPTPVYLLSFRHDLLFLAPQLSQLKQVCSCLLQLISLLLVRFPFLEAHWVFLYWYIWMFVLIAVFILLVSCAVSLINQMY